MGDIVEFASAVSDFEAWVMDGDDSGLNAVLTASMLLTRLYGLALTLRFEGSEDDLSEEEVDAVGDVEYRAVLSKLSRMPFQYYGEVFSPLIIPPENPVIGDISDDLADIYRDTVSALRSYDDGRVHEAVWSWVFGFNHHWGEHPTGAIRALDSYRREHL